MGRIVNIDGRVLNMQDDGEITDIFSAIEDVGDGYKITHTQNVTDILQYAYECRKGMQRRQNKTGDMRELAVVPALVFQYFPEIENDKKAFKKWLFNEKLAGRDWSTQPEGIKARPVGVL